ncbi:MAG: ABC transporter permease subunit [Sulfolobales archaeon]|nr:ABC transporter permease subunit [Sulfolobales archaeon]
MAAPDVVDQVLTYFLASLASVARDWVAIFLSVVTGWFLAYVALKSKVFENVYVSVLETLESVPVISFFPVVLVAFVYGIGGRLGVELAVLFLIFTATTWNIWMGQYQAFKTVPRDVIEVAENLRFTFWDKMLKIYIPYSIPRIASNTLPSFANALFYITVSEVFSVGSAQFSVFGIGTIVAGLTAQGDYVDLGIALAVLAVVVVVNVFAITKFADYAVSRYGFETEAVKVARRGRVRFGLTVRAGATLSKAAKVARLVPLRGRGYVMLEEEGEERRKFEIPTKVTYSLLAVLFAGLIIYGFYVNWGAVETALPYTGQILLGLAYDYLRVTVISLVAFAIAIFGGYFLVTHPRVEKPVIAFLQTFSAFPAPAYFPILFLATLPLVKSAFGPLTNEFYVLLLGFISTFYYIFYEVWLGIKNIPRPVWELMDNLNLGFFTRLRRIVLPGLLPYIITGMSSTVNSAWGGLAIGEFWPSIVQGQDLQVSHGLMLYFALWDEQGAVNLLAWGSFVFGVIVAIYSVLFTRKLMDLARKKYIIEESLYLI